MTKIYSEVQGIKKEVKNNSNEIADIKNVVLNIEQEHGQKLDALFDGYKQNSEQLSRIEDEVAKDEEVVLRRTK